MFIRSSQKRIKELIQQIPPYQVWLFLSCRADNNNFRHDESTTRPYTTELRDLT